MSVGVTILFSTGVGGKYDKLLISHLGTKNNDEYLFIYIYIYLLNTTKTYGWIKGGQPSVRRTTDHIPAFISICFNYLIMISRNIMRIYNLKYYFHSRKICIHS